MSIVEATMFGRPSKRLALSRSGGSQLWPVAKQSGKSSFVAAARMNNIDDHIIGHIWMSQRYRMLYTSSMFHH